MPLLRMSVIKKHNEKSLMNICIVWFLHTKIEIPGAILWKRIIIFVGCRQYCLLGQKNNYFLAQNCSESIASDAFCVRI